jgi:outer membrane usher protein FimD/PapC
VLVDGQPYDFVTAGRTAAVGLESLSNYRIGLEPEGAPDHDIDLGEKRITLYPGNVARLNWKAEQSVSLFGQVVDGQNKPLAQARVRAGSDSVTTDDNGYFTITSTAAQMLDIRLSDGGECAKIPLSELIANQPRTTLYRAGKITCEK